VESYRSEVSLATRRRVALRKGASAHHVVVARGSCKLIEEGVIMNMIYNSEQYSVVEFGVDHNLEALRFGGYEIVDKSGRREAFIGGKLAQSFRRDVNNLIASEPTMEEIDDFLGSYDTLMSQPVVLH
jgi:hypothetical protein